MVRARAAREQRRRRRDSQRGSANTADALADLVKRKPIGLFRKAAAEIDDLALAGGVDQNAGYRRAAFAEQPKLRDVDTLLGQCPRASRGRPHPRRRVPRTPREPPSRATATAAFAAMPPPSRGVCRRLLIFWLPPEKNASTRQI